MAYSPGVLGTDARLENVGAMARATKQHGAY